jgi:ribosome biogenesis protein NSA1
MGGVRRVEKGLAEQWVTNPAFSVRMALTLPFTSEAFISDNGGNLFALDLRNGKIAYGYKGCFFLFFNVNTLMAWPCTSSGIMGAVSSMALSPHFLASVSLDRFARIHSTYPLPSDPRHRQEKKGEVIDKVFVHTLPSVIVWDRHDDSKTTVKDPEQADKGDEDIWNVMENVGEVTGDDALSDSEAVQKRRRIAWFKS